MGMTFFTLTASVSAIKDLTAIAFVALYLIALATGGINPCVSSFSAGQFDEADDGKRKRKSSFICFYFSINVGALIEEKDEDDPDDRAELTERLQSTKDIYLQIGPAITIVANRILSWVI